MAAAVRVLCLHGMYQDARTFAAKTRHLCAACPELQVEYIYVDAPFTVVPPILTRKQPASAAASRPQSAKRALASGHKKNATEFRAWWRPLGIHESDPNQLDRDRALLLSFLRDKLRELGEVDGVMGFSQGASLAAWMCSEQGKRELDWTPKAVVLIGSYQGPPQYALEPGVLSGIPSLHLFGSNDHVIPARKSQHVADLFQEAATTDGQVVTAAHSQGHVIPKGDAALARFQHFLSHHVLGSTTATSKDCSTPPPPPPPLSRLEDAPPTPDTRQRLPSSAPSSP